MTYTEAAIQGLAHLRAYARQYPALALSEAVNALDSAGVFAALDEQADTALERGYVAVSRLGKLERVPGTDTLRPAPGEGFTQDQARALFGDVSEVN